MLEMSHLTRGGEFECYFSSFKLNDINTKSLYPNAKSNEKKTKLNGSFHSPTRFGDFECKVNEFEW